jgi:diacylglycerol kinase family enzyme
LCTGRNFDFLCQYATLSPVRAVAMLAPFAKEYHVRPFALPSVNVFTGNELDPTDEPDAALIFGGDGTVHRHLGTLVLRKTPVLAVPIGSANDFAATLGIDSVEHALAAWKRFCDTRQNLRLIDLGTIQPLRPLEAAELLPAAPDYRVEGPEEDESLETLHFVSDGPRRDLPQLGSRIERSQSRRWIEAAHQASRTHHFACIAGTGLDAVVSRQITKYPRWLRSHGGYVLALVEVLANFHPPQMTVSLEIAGRWQTPVREAGMVIAAGNGSRYGSGMRIAHLAELDDGLLDVCFVRRLNKLRLLRLLPVLFSGAHIGLKEVEYWKATRVRIQTEPVMDLFADGEYVCATPVELSVDPAALRVIVAG